MSQTTLHPIRQVQAGHIQSFQSMVSRSPCATKRAACAAGPCVLSGQTRTLWFLHITARFHHGYHCLNQVTLAWLFENSMFIDYMFTILRYTPFLSPFICMSCLSSKKGDQLAAVSTLIVMWCTEKMIKRQLAGVKAFMRPSKCTHKIFTDNVFSETCGFPSGHAAHAIFCASVVTSVFPHLWSLAFAVAFLCSFERVRM